MSAVTTRRAAPSLGILIIAGVVLIAVLVFIVRDFKGRPPNILLIVADTLRADHLGCYGFDKPTSPNIDLLAAGGTRFTKCYTVVPSTLASFTSLLSSMHPKDHGAYRNGMRADDSIPLLSEAFQNGGYETAAFIASYCLSADFGMDRGFTHFNEAYSGTTPLLDNKEIRSAKGVSNAFMKWIKGRSREQPFFAMVHYFDPHWPYNPPQQVMADFECRKIAPPGNMPSFIAAQASLKASKGVPGPFEENLHKLYCAEVRYMDNQIGRILETLDRSRLRDDTLIVFMSDHGETFWEHDDYWNHGRFVYDTTVHIPLIFNRPGFIPASKQCDAPLTTLDIGPTLCRLAGIEPPPTFEGVSFLDALVGNETRLSPERPLFSEATMPWSVEEGAPRPNLNKAKCVRSGPYKFIDFPYMEKERKELYHMEDDPAERRNLIKDPEAADLAELLGKSLDQWARSYRDLNREIKTMDKETLKKLNDLGYTGN